MIDTQQDLVPWLDVADWKAAVDMDFVNETLLEDCELFQPRPDNRPEDSASTSVSPASCCGGYAKTVLKPTKKVFDPSMDIKIEVYSGLPTPPTHPAIAVPAVEEKTQGQVTTRPGRVPKWKRRNPQKHLDGERSRRAKRKDKINALTALLPKLKGKVTTNDLLEATLKKVREEMAERRPSSTNLCVRTMMLGCSSMACFALDVHNRVIEASSSFLTWLNWPPHLPVVGQHISALMVHEDAFRLSSAISEERGFRCLEGMVLANHMAGFAHFLRFEQPSPQAPGRQLAMEPLEIEVGVDPHKTVCHFMLPVSKF